MSMRLFSRQKSSESGNIFLAIFGAVALVGLLGASIMTFMKGPLSTSVKLTKINTAENQMAIGSQVAVMAAANQANNGDCDSDGTIEPVEWRTATTEPIPVGGGLVPLTLGINKKDPWGTEYGYCAWNYGTIISQSGTCGANMLQGNTSNAYPVVALISAGPDKTFTTTCLDFGGADINHNGILDGSEHPLVSKAAETDDDIITSYTYEEATGVSGGLWSLKAGSPGTAVINKKIEASGVADLKGGVLLPDKAFINCNLASNAGVMAKSTAGIEICDGTGIWKTIGGGASGALSATATCASSTDAGNVRYDSVSGQPQFCNGTSWLPFSINTPGVNLVINPSNNNAMNVNGASNQDTVKCTVASGYICGSGVAFTVTNQGTTTSGTMVIQVLQTINGVVTTYSAATLASATNTSNFVLTANTCTTILAVNGTCTVTLEPKAKGNTTYTATLKVNVNNTPLAVISGTANNFGCTPGAQGGGGIYSYCGLTDADTGASYDLIVQPGGCTGSTNNPVCAGGTDTVSKIAGNGCCTVSQIGPFANYVGSDVYGARNSMTVMKMVTAGMGTFPAVQYCRQMNYGGYTDWYLPSRQEMVSFIYPNKAAIGGFQNNVYSTSLIGQNNDYGYADMNGGGSGGESVVYNRYVRCARRDNIPLPTVPVINNPAPLTIAPGITFTSGARVSATATVSGILDPMTVKITGSSGTPNFSVNGAAPVTTASVTNGQTIQFFMDAPTVLGTKNTATINWGASQTYSWWTGYADSSKTVVGFATSGTYSGSIGGLSGADAICKSVAATSPYGLSGNWKAILSDTTTSANSRIPWNWGILKGVTGNIIVDGGLNDLFDGTFDDFFNVTEIGSTTTNTLWTGSNEYGSSYNSSGATAYYFNFDWTNNGYGSSLAQIGQAGSKGTTALNSGNTMGYYPQGLRCIEDIDGAVNTIPTRISPPYAVQVPTSSRQTSAAVLVSGMSSGTSTTLTVTASAGSPTVKINGGAETTSGIIKNGDSLVFLMDAPATGNSNNKMTMTVGGSTVAGNWRVWTGDTTGTIVKRVFVGNNTSNTQGTGVGGYDSYCTSAATAAGLGGTWKAIISGVAEQDYAVNRVGYNWTTLKRVDGVDVVLAGNLWSTNNTPLLTNISKSETGATVSQSNILTNTLPNGNAANTVASTTYGGSCNNWGTYSSGWTAIDGTSGSSGTSWINDGSPDGNNCYTCCGGGQRIYCIEQ